MKLIKLHITAILIFLHFHSTASHIIGGEITVAWKSGNVFHITLNFYRDCSSSVYFDTPSVSVGIYDLVTNANISCSDLPLIDTTTLALGDSCYTPTNLCVQLGVYAADITIPDNPNGYYLSYNRCCRNAVLINLTNSGNVGETWYAEIPDPALHNSTPVFAKSIAGYACMRSINLDLLPSTDVDGDSLVYSLETPLASNTSSENACPNGGPYSTVAWQSPYSLMNMIGGTPMIVNDSTGVITCDPIVQGAFVICGQVEEYDRVTKKKLGEIRRDVQYTTLPCSPCIAGINVDNNNNVFLVYPNPSQGSITIQSDGIKSGNVNADVYNMLGKKIYSLVITGEEIRKGYRMNFNSSSSGLYLLVFQIGDAIVSKKISIEK